MKMGSTMINGGLDLIIRLAKAAGESQGAKSAQMGVLGPIHQNFCGGPSN